MMIDLGPCVLRAMTLEDADWAGPVLAGTDPWRTLGYGAALLTQYLGSGDPSLARFTVWVEDQRAGVVALRYPWLRGPFLELLAITQPGRGLGTVVVAWAVERGGGNLWTSVSRFNTEARRFYERQGFAEAAVLPDLIKPGFDEVLMRRRGDGG